MSPGDFPNLPWSIRRDDAPGNVGPRVVDCDGNTVLGASVDRSEMDDIGVIIDADNLLPLIVHAVNLFAEMREAVRGAHCSDCLTAEQWEQERQSYAGLVERMDAGPATERP
jgi:hypothetical protein